jgi:branched-chain amino acid transport system ATP-binding protein
VTELLSAQGVSKRFGGITALDDVSLEVGEGEAVGLIGPNGAGKTTFFNCLLGILRPNRGQITFAGTDLTRLPVYRRARLGLGRTFQRVELFPEMTVREHLLVAERVRRGDGSVFKDLINRGGPSADERDRVDAVLARLGLSAVADTPVESLTLGRSRLVELGRALIGEPRLLLLDEPSSGLDTGETLELAAVVNDVRAERGTAILLVEHDLEMVYEVVDRIYVLDFGRLIAAGPTAEVFDNEEVRRAYLGDTDASGSTLVEQ